MIKNGERRGRECDIIQMEEGMREGKLRKEERRERRRREREE